MGHRFNVNQIDKAGRKSVLLSCFIIQVLFGNETHALLFNSQKILLKVDLS